MGEAASSEKKGPSAHPEEDARTADRPAESQPPPAGPPPAADAAPADTKPAGRRGPRKGGRRDQIRPGVYHRPGTTAVRLVRPHRWRSGMFEVFEFNDEQVSEEIREAVRRQGGWRDQDKQWYDLVESAHAERLEIFRRNPTSKPDCPWNGWSRLGSRYSPARPCAGCGASFRHADEAKTLCGDCVQTSADVIEQSIDELQQSVESEDRLPKGCWQQVQSIRESIDKAEKEKQFSRARLSRLRQKLHPVYRILIDRRRREQDAYRQLVSELEGRVKAVLDRSLGSDQPERSVVEELKNTRIHIRRLLDDRKLGIREFRRFIEELKKASEHEEGKFSAHRKEQEQRQERWENGERVLSERVNSVEIDIEHNPENWRRLLALREEINGAFQAGDLGTQGRKRLLDLVNHLMDQEGTLRDMAREEKEVKVRVRKETSRKRALELKKEIKRVAIGLGYSQGLWNDLVALQRSVIQLKNEGGITLDDFKDVMAQVNAKLDTLKKLRGWSQEGS